jgi:hypothetical protein
MQRFVIISVLFIFVATGSTSYTRENLLISGIF